jgi:exodeoxyribonuclease-3
VRLVAWNCRSAFHRKIDALMRIRPDIAIVAECANLQLLFQRAPATFDPSSAIWVGSSNPQKGLAVFAFGEYRLTRAERYDPPITFAVPLHVDGPLPLNLLAVWAHYGLAPLRKSTRGPTLRALARYREFLREPTLTIVAGDLNNHVRWDRPGKAWSHARAVAAFGRLGLVSAYHTFLGVEQGAERHPTFYWRTRSALGPTAYHIDYVFIPRGALGELRAVSVGTWADWIGPGLSDHAPIVVDLDPVSTTRTGGKNSSYGGGLPPRRDVTCRGWKRTALVEGEHRARGRKRTALVEGQHGAGDFAGGHSAECVVDVG